jgi:integral membrane protein
MQTPLSIKRAAQLNRFGTLESISLLILLLIAMPLKYLWDQPLLVRWVGLAHGILFIVYTAIVFRAQLETRWPMWYTVVAFLASFIPFGPALVMTKLLNPQVKV